MYNDLFSPNKYMHNNIDPALVRHSTYDVQHKDASLPVSKNNMTMIQNILLRFPKLYYLVK